MFSVYVTRYSIKFFLGLNALHQNQCAHKMLVLLIYLSVRRLFVSLIVSLRHLEFGFIFVFFFFFYFCFCLFYTYYCFIFLYARSKKKRKKKRSLIGFDSIFISSIFLVFVFVYLWKKKKKKYYVYLNNWVRCAIYWELDLTENVLVIIFLFFSLSSASNFYQSKRKSKQITRQHTIDIFLLVLSPSLLFFFSSIFSFAFPYQQK